MTTAAAQRLNMVESQIRPNDVTDRRILRAFAEVERERFLPSEMAGIAYMDQAVPLVAGAKGAAGRTLMEPRAFAKLIQLAAIEASDAVLVVGAGRGYSAAIIAMLSASVTALESEAVLADAAKANLAGSKSVTVVTGPLAAGPSGDQQYDVIVVEGAVYERPEALIGRLKPGGRLVAVLAANGVGRATQWTKTESTIAEAQSFEAGAPALPGFERRAAFVF